jgi:hypothetical protein
MIGSLLALGKLWNAATLTGTLAKSQGICMRIFIVFSTWILICLCGASLAEEDRSKQRLTFGDHTASIVFRASFDVTTTAEIGGGDKRIHTAESLERKESKVGLQTEAVRREETQGERGGALHFVSPTKELVYFKGGRNLPYRKSGFEGTVSLWMKLSPKEELPKGFVDPLQITDKKWNDASMFVDFDQTNERPFRLGFFSDYGFWNPDDTRFDDIPEKERPMIQVTDWPFDKSRWTHVALTWINVNTDDKSTVTLYLDGKRQGSLDTKQRFTWAPEEAVIMLGINYVGWIDDLIILNRALPESEIAVLQDAD